MISRLFLLEWSLLSQFPKTPAVKERQMDRKFENAFKLEMNNAQSCNIACVILLVTVGLVKCDFVVGICVF